MISLSTSTWSLSAMSSLRVLAASAVFLLAAEPVEVHSFRPPVVFGLRSSGSNTESSTVLLAKPERYPDNAEGVVYVNDKCINCAACSLFAPSSFSRSLSLESSDENYSGYHVVHKQPETLQEVLEARAALAACPVAAIRVETKAERQHRAGSDKEKKAVDKGWTNRDEELVRQMGLSPAKSGLRKPFPRQLLDSVADVYWVGHHNDASFGATPYLFQTQVMMDKNNMTKVCWIMVDTPRFGASALEAVTSLTGPHGPDYLVLTHVDDTADHGKWANHFSGTLKRIFHAGDLGPANWLNDKTLEHVEILLPKPTRQQQQQNDNSLMAFTLDGTILPPDWETSTTASDLPVVILYTPGHSPGSITLYKRPVVVKNDDDDDASTRSLPAVLFTGDTYAYRAGHRDGSNDSGGHMSGFPRYGNQLDLQAETMQKLLRLDWDVVAPGHGHARDYTSSINGTTTATTTTREEKQKVQADEMKVAIDELKAFHEERVGLKKTMQQLNTAG